MENTFKLSKLTDISDVIPLLGNGVNNLERGIFRVLSTLFNEVCKCRTRVKMSFNRYNKNYNGYSVKFIENSVAEAVHFPVI